MGSLVYPFFHMLGDAVLISGTSGVRRSEGGLGLSGTGEPGPSIEAAGDSDTGNGADASRGPGAGRDGRVPGQAGLPLSHPELAVVSIHRF